MRLADYDNYVFKMVRSRYDYKPFRLATVAGELGLEVMLFWEALNRLRSAGKLTWHEHRGANLFDKELLIIFPQP